MTNPFPYSLDNKRYHTFNYYLKTNYHTKVSKVILDGGFSCPNRDGAKGYGGCIFCSLKGSGDSNLALSSDILNQYNKNKEVMDRKWKNGKYIPYFQSFSNTYGPLSKIKAMIEPFLSMDEVCEIAIATRADCLKEETIEYLNEITSKKVVTIELGLQSSNDASAEWMNRGHDFTCFKDAVMRLSKTNIKVCIHIMNSLPCEKEETMLKTIEDIKDLPFHALKIHMLHVLKDTKLGEEYLQKPFPLMTREDYINLVVKQLELLPPEIVIERLTGDPLKEELLAPDWVLNKTTILNDIDKKMRELNTWQGKKYECK